LYHIPSNIFVISVSGALPAAQSKTILPKILNACHHFHCVFSYTLWLQKHNKLKLRSCKGPLENSSKDIFLGSLYSTPVRTPGIFILALQYFSTHSPPKHGGFITSWTSFSIRRIKECLPYQPSWYTCFHHAVIFTAVVV